MFWSHIVLPAIDVYSKSCKNTHTTPVVATTVPAFVYVRLTNGTSKTVWCAPVQFPFYPLEVRIGKGLGLLGRHATGPNARQRWQTLCTVAWFWHLTLWRMGWADFLIYIHCICSCGNQKSFFLYIYIPDMEGLYLLAGENDTTVMWACLTISLRASVRTGCH